MSFSPDVVSFFAACRMVLVAPCGDGELLAALKASSVPAVGADLDPVRVQALRDGGTPAWTARVADLVHFPSRFDGACLLADAELCNAEGIQALGTALLPRARVLIVGDPDGLAAIKGLLPSGVEVVDDSTAGLRLIWPSGSAKASGVASEHIVVAPYADLMVGCGAVVELGAGAGHFLDALRLRDLECVGIERDPDLVRRGQRRAHRYVEVDQLIAQMGGVVLGMTGAPLAAEARGDLLDGALSLVRPGGRLLLRAPADDLMTLRDELGARVEMVRAGRAPRDPREGFVLAVRAAAEPAEPVGPVNAAALARGMAALAPSGPLPINQPPASLFDLERFERRVFSQGGEDGVLEVLFDQLGTTNCAFAEFGCGDGVQCNTAYLRQQGWQGLLMDGVAEPGAPGIDIVEAWITAENIESLLDAHGVPREPDLLSIDLDGNDYWVWRAIQRRPRVVIAEYNGNLPADHALTIPYDPTHRWDGSDYYGASLGALVQLGREKGYTLVYCTQAGVNAFFVRDDLVGKQPVPPTETLFRPANYWYRGGRQIPNLERRMVALDG